MTTAHNAPYVSGKSRRRIENSQRMKKRFFKGGYLVISDLKFMTPAMWDAAANLSLRKAREREV